MTVQSEFLTETGSDDEAYVWIGRVLTNFAIAEQAIGQLCLRLDLPIANGTLSSLAELRSRLRASADRKCHALEKRIERWAANRPFRNLLAHCTIMCLTDRDQRLVIATRHLPRDKLDVTPDRLWTLEERSELLRQATNDGRSISDHINGLLCEPTKLAKLQVSQP